MRCSTCATTGTGALLRCFMLFYAVFLTGLCCVSADFLLFLNAVWNSLLETSTLPMANRTGERFPQADVLVDYIRDFAAEQEASGGIAYVVDAVCFRYTCRRLIDLLNDYRYGTTVTKIERSAGTGTEPSQSFSLSVTSSSDPDASKVTCGAVVIAQGLHAPNIPEGWDTLQEDGRKMTQGYEELAVDGRDYENRAVVRFFIGFFIGFFIKNRGIVGGFWYGQRWI